jgi:hypothetical protein
MIVRAASAIAVLLSACSTTDQRGPITPPSAIAPASIGAASMTEDGSISLQIFLQSESGAIGEGVLIYDRADPSYDAVLQHLGGLTPGQVKPIPPWPDLPLPRRPQTEN